MLSLSRCWFGLLLLLAAAASASAQQKILYVTTSAGFRHDCLPLSAEVIRQICARSRACEVTHTEDTAAINAENLRGFRAVFFYTSGELPLSVAQKQALLDFVATGGAFAGFHSATDTLYTWPEYGTLIGGYFDGHPWAQEAQVLVDMPDHQVTRSLPSPWRLTEEYYQFRNFVQEGTAVLLSLDTESVDLKVPGVNTARFPLAWVRQQGSGRVFYTALGHFEDTWRNAVFQRLIENAIGWLLSQSPTVLPNGVANAASMSPPAVIAPGSLISIMGSALTADGRSESATGWPYPESLAGTMVAVGDRNLPLLYAGPSQINAWVPPDLRGSACTSVFGRRCLTPSTAVMDIRNALGKTSYQVFFTPVTPGVFAVTTQPTALTVWATGLGPVTRGPDGLDRIDRAIQASIGDRSATVLFAGLAPGVPGLYQVNLDLPSGIPEGSTQRVEIVIDGTPFVTHYIHRAMGAVADAASSNRNR